MMVAVGRAINLQFGQGTLLTKMQFLSVNRNKRPHIIPSRCGSHSEISGT